MKKVTARTTPKSLADLPPQTVQSAGALATDTLRAWAAAVQHRLVTADLAGIRERRSALRAIGRAFAFPAWFGANLDALYDSLTDLPEHAATAGWVVVLERLNELKPDDAAALLDVFRDAAEDFGKRGLPFRVFYR